MKLRIHLFTLLALASTALVAATARADSTPVGPLPAGPVSTIATKQGQLIAVALPTPPARTGLVWRIARSYDSHVVRQVSEANVGSNVVVVYKVVGRGRTSIVFAKTKGDTSSKAVASRRYEVRAS
jgi:hypothetical protein